MALGSGLGLGRIWTLLTRDELVLPWFSYMEVTAATALTTDGTIELAADTELFTSHTLLGWSLVEGDEDINCMRYPLDILEYRRDYSARAAKPNG